MIELIIFYDYFLFYRIENYLHINSLHKKGKLMQCDSDCNKIVSGVNTISYIFMTPILQ